ncbi:SCO4402 family protein [Streptomyces sp. NBC_00442]|uniref:SCO4402 family protein n=1 Tax=Streptomyces sp. NBC_00442 TaxID=2903651 RepID=UPI003FA762D4
MGGMPLNDMPWWRWRTNVRSALHMLSDPVFHEETWLAGREGFGDVTDAVYRLVEDTWLDNWSAEKYVGTIFRDSGEAAAVDLAVLRLLRIMHQVGADAPVSAYLAHEAWPEAVLAAREAHVRLAQSDGEDPDAPPRSLEVLSILTRSA